MQTRQQRTDWGKSIEVFYNNVVNQQIKRCMKDGKWFMINQMTKSIRVDELGDMFTVDETNAPAIKSSVPDEKGNYIFPVPDIACFDFKRDIIGWIEVKTRYGMVQGENTEGYPIPYHQFRKYRHLVQNVYTDIPFFIVYIDTQSLEIFFTTMEEILRRKPVENCLLQDKISGKQVLNLIYPVDYFSKMNKTLKELGWEGQ
jgi:hypothetical protein